MPYSIKVIIIDGDLEERKQISDILSSVSDVLIAGETDNAEDGMKLAGELSPGVIITGRSVGGADSFVFCEAIASKYPFQPVIMVAVAAKEEVFRRAMRAGIREIVTSPDRISLSDAIYKAYDAREKRRASVESTGREPILREKTAKIFSVFSTKGGVGKTAISSNLAVMLKRSGKKVALLDLDIYSGDVAIAMDIVPKRNLSDLVSHIGKLDLDLLESYMFKHSSGVMLLPAPSKIEYGDFVAAEHVTKILRLLVKEYDYIVVDCACYMHDPVLVALDASDAILLVTTMDIFAIKNLKSCITALEASNYSRSKFRLVVNRATREAGISVKDIEATIGLPAAAVIPQEDSVVLKSINQGTPVVIAYKNSGFARGIGELVRKLDTGVSGKADLSSLRKSPTSPAAV